MGGRSLSAATFFYGYCHLLYKLIYSSVGEPQLNLNRNSLQDYGVG